MCGTIQCDPANAVLGTGFPYSHFQRSWLQRSFDALGTCTQGRLAAGATGAVCQVYHVCPTPSTVSCWMQAIWKSKQRPRRKWRSAVAARMHAIWTVVLAEAMAARTASAPRRPARRLLQQIVHLFLRVHEGPFGRQRGQDRLHLVRFGQKIEASPPVQDVSAAGDGGLGVGGRRVSLLKSQPSMHFLGRDTTFNSLTCP